MERERDGWMVALLVKIERVGRLDGGATESGMALLVGRELDGGTIPRERAGRLDGGATGWERAERLDGGFSGWGRAGWWCCWMVVGKCDSWMVRLLMGGRERDGWMVALLVGR